jgi:hypothetical protein
VDSLPIDIVNRFRTIKEAVMHFIRLNFTEFDGVEYVFCGPGCIAQNDPDEVPKRRLFFGLQNYGPMVLPSCYVQFISDTWNQTSFQGREHQFRFRIHVVEKDGDPAEAQMKVIELLERMGQAFSDDHTLLDACHDTEITGVMEVLPLEEDKNNVFTGFIELVCKLERLYQQ